MKTLLFMIAAVALLVAGGLLGRFIETRPDLAPQLAASEAHAAALDKQVKTLQASNASLNSEVDGLQSRLAAAKTIPVRSTAAKAAAAEAAASSPAPEAAPAEGAKPLAALAEMAKNPVMREMAKKQQAAMRDMIYADLYTALHFDDGDKAYFKQLLANRAEAQMDLAYRLMDPALTPEARQAAIAESNQQKEQSNADIRAFLDKDSDYQAFQHYDETQGERMMLTMNKSAFDAEPLTPQQETQLIDTMHSVATSFSDTPDPNLPKTFDPGQFTQAALDAQIQKLDRNAQAVSQAATTFLSPRQQQILQQIQASQRAMTITGWQMMKSFGGGAK
jgi:hypothetical protein